MANPISPSVEIAAPKGCEDNTAIKALFVEYAESLGFSLAYQGFAAELAEFPGKYARPRGGLLLARVDGVAAGTVALRALTEDICEMKRLYVKPSFRAARTADGRSLGRALAEGIVTVGRALEYRRLRLDTISDKMGAAVKLYRTMGFADIAPYYDSPVPGTAYMELVL